MYALFKHLSMLFIIISYSSVLMELFVKLYKFTIMELGYNASVAQLEYVVFPASLVFSLSFCRYSLTIAFRGLSLTMSGLSHKLPVSTFIPVIHLIELSYLYLLNIRFCFKT